MAVVAEQRLAGRIARGVAVIRDAAGARLERIAVHEAAHPVPDARSASAGREALRLAAEAEPEDVLLVLLSGGASSLLSCPLPGLTLEDLASTTQRLLAAGADIFALNTVRKHLTQVAGGRLAAASRAGWIEVWAISDVLGDDLSTIASGPCMGDPTTYAQAREILRAHGLSGRGPRAALAVLEEGAAGARPETPKPGAPELAAVRSRILARNADALRAAEGEARDQGLEPLQVTGSLRGEARVAGTRLGALCRALRPGPPRLLLAGGETTVTVRGNGLGGRSQELALAAALRLAGTSGATLLAAGTDGSDGPTGAAGAFADGETVARGSAAGVEAGACLRRNDSHDFFAHEGGLLVTGPTGTNVMDLVLARVERLGEAPPRAVGVPRIHEQSP